MMKRTGIALIAAAVILPLVLIAKEDSRVVAGRIKTNAGQAKNIAVLLDRFTVELRKVASETEVASAAIYDRGDKRKVQDVETKIDDLVAKAQFLKQKSDELSSIVAAMDRDSDLLLDLAGQKRKKKGFRR